MYVRQLLDREDGEGTAAQPAQEVVTNGPGHLLVVAGPGGGKSTLVRQLTSTFTNGWLEDDASLPLVPLSVTAAELARQPKIIETALTPTVLPTGLRWLVLVDGVDEIVDGATRRAFVLRLARFAERHLSTHQLVVTTRELPRDEHRALRAAGLTPYSLEPFDRPRLISFAEGWFDDKKTAENYIRQVDRACLGPLVRVPLLATITAVVYEAYPGNPLPGNQYLLYEQYRRHLARIKQKNLHEHWQRLTDAVRNEFPGASAAIQELAAERGEALLHFLAIEQTSHGVENLTQVALLWLDERLDVPASRLILGWPDHVKGLLAGTGMMVRTPADIRFLHTSFAEHMAAEFRSKQLPSILSFANSAWRAVIERARAHEQASLATLIHAAHRSTALAKDLLKMLESGTDADHLVAAHLLAEGPILDDAHAQWFLAQLGEADPDLDPDWWRLAARIGHPNVTELLIELACQPGERRYAAAAALTAHQPDAASAELLNIVLAVEEAWVTRCDAVRDLARLGDRRARQAAQVLREQLLEEPRDRFNRESAVAGLMEVYSIGELEEFFRNRALRQDGTVDLIALSTLAALSEEHAEETRDRLVALITSASMAPIVDQAVEALVDLPGSMGVIAFSDLLASASLGLQQRLQLASKGIAAGLDQEEILSTLLRASSQSPPCELIDDYEVFSLARSLSVFMDQLHEDASGLLKQAQEDFWSPGRYVPTSRAVPLILMVAGWDFLKQYEWSDPGDRLGGFDIVELILVDAKVLSGGHKASYDELWDRWLYVAEWAARRQAGWLGGPHFWSSWLGILASNATETSLWAPVMVDTVMSFTVEESVPEAGRAAVALMLVLLLCVSGGLMDREQRAAQLRKLSAYYSEYPLLCRRLNEIAETVQW
ncbi:NACHT domain-containing protein [Streptomyces sp. NPDC059787]|uniref:NACHT domain-containing protein n=1 Tax=Streptomyces sp. NPDC059787 TaxID=3346947 RepID=UPI003662CE90